MSSVLTSIFQLLLVIVITLAVLITLLVVAMVIALIQLIFMRRTLNQHRQYIPLMVRWEQYLRQYNRPQQQETEQTHHEFINMTSV